MITDRFDIACTSHASSASIKILLSNSDKNADFSALVEEKICIHYMILAFLNNPYPVHRVDLKNLLQSATVVGIGNRSSSVEGQHRILGTWCCSPPLQGRASKRLYYYLRKTGSPLSLKTKQEGKQKVLFYSKLDLFLGIEELFYPLEAWSIATLMHNFQLLFQVVKWFA